MTFTNIKIRPVSFLFLNTGTSISMSRLLFSRFAQYLEAIARLGSIRKAAAELNVSASAIDKQLIRAEEELGVALFERLPRGMRLTAAGEILIHGVKGWRKDFSRITFEIEQLKGLRRGEVKIAVSQETVFDFLPGAMARFMRDHPRIRNTVLVAESHQVRKLVLDGLADFGLTFSPRPLPGVTVTRSAPFHLHAVVPAGTVSAAETTLSLEAFFQNPIIIPDASTHLRDAVDIAAARTGTRLQPVLTTNSLDLMRSMVGECVGFGLIALSQGAEARHDNGLAYLPLSDRGLPPLTLSLIIDPQRSPSMTAILMRQYFEAHFDDLGNRAEATSEFSKLAEIGDQQRNV